MTKKIDRNDLETVDEIPLEALDNILGGAGTAPMGMGGSLAAAATQAAPTSHGVGYHDHFGLHLGATGVGDHNGLGFHEAHDPHATSQAQANGFVGTHASPSPMGMGGSLGGTGPGATATTGDASAQHATTAGEVASASTGAAAAASQFEVNATSAFSLVDQGAPQDDAAAVAAEHGPAPVGLGGDY